MMRIDCILSNTDHNTTTYVSKSITHFTLEILTSVLDCHRIFLQFIKLLAFEEEEEEENIGLEWINAISSIRYDLPDPQPNRRKRC
jgi:hypothetical protein